MVEEREAQQRAMTGKQAYERAVQMIDDADELHEAAAKVIEQKKRLFAGVNDEGELMELVQMAYDIARGQVGKTKGGRKAEAAPQPTPVAGGSPAPAPSGDDDAWAEMEQFRGALGL